MEYDKTTSDGTPEAKNYPHSTTTHDEGNGRLRIKSDTADTRGLGEPLTFLFSGRTAPNRFLKAPMTERLCHWNTPDQDTVRLQFTPRITPITDHQRRMLGVFPPMS